MTEEQIIYNYISHLCTQLRRLDKSILYPDTINYYYGRECFFTLYFQSQISINSGFYHHWMKYFINFPIDDQFREYIVSQLVKE